MYGNRGGGVYSITGDMCYENKVMTNSTPSIGPPETIRLAIPDSQQPSYVDEKRKAYKPTLAFVVNVLIILVVGITLGFIEFDVIPTNKFGYYCGDPSISYPFKGDTITATWLILGSVLGPLIVIAAVEYKTASPRRSLRVAWRWYREMLIGLTVTLMVTEVMKAIVGEPRPHFITTCKPDTESSCENGTFVREFKCTGNEYGIYVVGDSSRSFPSGHTSISVFVSIFCVALLHYRFRTRRFGQLTKPFLTILFLSWGLLCGLTRVTDRRHHWWDVLAGGIIGAIGAAWTIIALVKLFRHPSDGERSPISSRSTLLDEKKDVTCVI